MPSVLIFFFILAELVPVVLPVPRSAEQVLTKGQPKDHLTFLVCHQKTGLPKTQYIIILWVREDEWLDSLSDLFKLFF